MKKLDVSQLFEVVMEVGMYDKRIDSAKADVIRSVDTLGKLVAKELNVGFDGASYGALGLLASFYPKQESAPCPGAIATRDDEGEWSMPHLGTIVFADDDITTTALGSVTLKNEGFRVLTAMNGEEAWDYFEDPDITVDMLITDIAMPGNDGYWLCEQVAAKYRRAKSIPMVTISGVESEEAAKSKLRVHRGIQHLPKPVDWNLLSLYVKELFAKRRVETELERAREEQGDYARDSVATLTLASCHPER